MMFLLAKAFTGLAQRMRISRDEMPRGDWPRIHSLKTHLRTLSLNRPIDEPIDTLKDLNPDEVEALEEWSQFFASKYPFVGQLIENNIEQ